MSAQKFDRGDRVRVAEGYHWAQHASGAIEPHPDPEIDCSRDVKSLQGMLTFYWVHFDAPQTDGEGESGYVQAEMDERYLEKQPKI